MSTHTQHSRWFRLSGGVALTAAAVLAAYVPACRRLMREESYKCADKEVKADRKADKGVDKDTIVLCKHRRVRWRDKSGENWQVRFDVSPFESGVKDIKKGDPDPGPVIQVDQDTAFKYSITVDGKTFDPQIIIMGP